MEKEKDKLFSAFRDAGLGQALPAVILLGMVVFALAITTSLTLYGLFPTSAPRRMSTGDYVLLAVSYLIGLLIASGGVALLVAAYKFLRAKVRGDFQNLESGMAWLTWGWAMFALFVWGVLAMFVYATVLEYGFL